MDSSRDFLLDYAVNTDNIKQEPVDTGQSLILEVVKEEPHSQADITFTAANIKHEPPVEFTCILPYDEGSRTGTESEEAYDSVGTLNKPTTTNRQSQKRTKCHICGLFYKRIKQHVEHKHVQHFQQRKPFSCEICRSRFEKESTLASHTKYRHTQPFRCDLCEDACYPKKLQIVRHISLVHLHFNDKLTCKTCYQTSKSAAALRQHMKAHEKVECPICLKLYGSNNLNTHLQLVHQAKDENPKFQCPICKRAFFARKNYDRHMKTHTKPFKCSLCNYSCSRKYLLDRHIDLHDSFDANENHSTKFSVYQCNRCSKRNVFRTQLSVFKHIKRKHKGFTGDFEKLYHKVPNVEKFQYFCDFCPKVFITKQAVLTHLKIVHFTRERNFPCDNCRYRAKSKSNLVSHKKSMHETS